MRTQLLTCLLVLLAAGVGVAVPLLTYGDTLDIDDYYYYTEIEVYNSGGVGTDVWVPVTFSAAAFVSGGFLQADGVDAVYADAGDVKLGTFMQDMALATSTWWGRAATLPAAGSTTLYLHHGDSIGTDTKDQAFWIDTATSQVVVSDDASLDITTNLTVESVVNLSTIPTAESFLLRKAEAYELGVSGGNTVFARVFKDSTDTETLDPTGAGNYTNLLPTGSANNWENVEDASDSTWNATSAGAWTRDSYAIANTAIGSSAVIAGVRIDYRANYSGGGSGDARPFLRVGGTDYDDSQQALSPSTSAYSSSVWATNPDTSAAWTTTTINALEGGMSLIAAGGADTRLKKLAVVVIYRSAVTASSATISVDTQYVLLGTYDGTNLRLYRNGTQVATTTSSVTINSNGNSVVVGAGAARGQILRSRIGDTSLATPTYKLDLQYEPDQTAQTQEGNAGNAWHWLGTVTDQSASTNDGVYTMYRDTSALTDTMGTLYIRNAPALAAVTATSVDFWGGGDTNLSQTPPSPSAFSFPLVDEIIATASDWGMTAQVLMLALFISFGYGIATLVYVLQAKVGQKSDFIPSFLFAAFIFLGSFMGFYDLIWPLMIAFFMFGFTGATRFTRRQEL